MFSKVGQPKKDEFVHVNEPVKKDPIEELCDRIDKAFETYKDRHLDLGYGYSEAKRNQYMYALNSMQMSFGKLNEYGVGLWRDEPININDIEKTLGRMLFSMEVLAQAYGFDLTDIVDQCERICEASERTQ